MQNQWHLMQNQSLFDSNQLHEETCFHESNGYQSVQPRMPHGPAPAPPQLDATANPTPASPAQEPSYLLQQAWPTKSCWPTKNCNLALVQEPKQEKQQESMTMIPQSVDPSPCSAYSNPPEGTAHQLHYLENACQYENCAPGNPLIEQEPFRNSYSNPEQTSYHEFASAGAREKPRDEIISDARWRVFNREFGSPSSEEATTMSLTHHHLSPRSERARSERRSSTSSELSRALGDSRSPQRSYSPERSYSPVARVFSRSNSSSRSNSFSATGSGRSSVDQHQPQQSVYLDKNNTKQQSISKAGLSQHQTAFQCMGINLEQYISKRNERERSRVRNVNDAFDHLKFSLPLDVEKLGKRMSKVEILRSAIGYIRNLENLLSSKEKLSAQDHDSMKILASKFNEAYEYQRNSQAKTPDQRYSDLEDSRAHPRANHCDGQSFHAEHQSCSRSLMQWDRMPAQSPHSRESNEPIRFQ